MQGNILPGIAFDFSQMESVGFFFLKLLFLLAFLLYSVFAFIVIRQVRIMGNTYETSLGAFLTLFAWAHFFLSLAILIFAFIAL